ncbi:MAG: hypothetical protein ACK42D_02830 [Candidatus Paceibacteria bacterium]
MQKSEVEKLCSIDPVSFDWALLFVGKLEGDISKVKAYLGAVLWLTEARYQMLPEKTQDRIWAVVYILSELWLSDESETKR